MAGKYYVYIVECSDKTFYIGKSVDVQKRLKQHNGLLAGGAKYTKSRRPVKLRYLEICSSGSGALKKEYELKKLSRKNKAGLIERFKEDLSLAGES